MKENKTLKYSTANLIQIKTHFDGIETSHFVLYI